VRYTDTSYLIYRQWHKSNGILAYPTCLTSYKNRRESSPKKQRQKQQQQQPNGKIHVCKATSHTAPPPLSSSHRSSSTSVLLKTNVLYVNFELAANIMRKATHMCAIQYTSGESTVCNPIHISKPYVCTHISLLLNIQAKKKLSLRRSKNSTFCCLSFIARASRNIIVDAVGHGIANIQDVFSHKSSHSAVIDVKIGKIAQIRRLFLSRTPQQTQ
jgi:hypothetical protein